MLDVKVTLKRTNFALNAELHDGGYICLSGLNGSGKSTLLNIIAGKLRADDGYVKVNSVDVTRLPLERRDVVLVNPDSLLPHLEVDKHLVWGAQAKKVAVDPSKVESLKRLLGIDYSGRVDKLSLGMRERVSLATAYLSGPKAILVDEAFSNIDHREDFVRAYTSVCKEEKIDVVSTTQQKADADFADHHYDIVDGVSSKVF